MGKSSNWNSETGESFSSSGSSDLGYNPPNNAHLCNWAPRPKLCKHGFASLRTSHTSVNPFRRFYCCSLRGSREACGLWEWFDPELNDYYKEQILKLRLQSISAEEERDQATMNAALSRERMDTRERESHSVVVELDLLKAKNDVLEGTVCKDSDDEMVYLCGGCLVCYAVALEVM
ncbi:uncharacterized protein LOC130990713 [Salvia miltiorrhiza]|uniref:uncharacterized protein LOC130990713 n=1 Tax=Salvia miltiorrhiza TaxID=226208 RepID=UPI0025AC0BBA|nr:uncharacterized protein LOC130990713 [Salvia miltiorrhiza]